MLELLKFACSGFWTFLGCAFILGMIIKLITYPIRIYFRHQNIKSQGWPPAHVDADGDLKENG